MMKDISTETEEVNSSNQTFKTFFQLYSTSSATFLLKSSRKSTVWGITWPMNIKYKIIKVGLQMWLNGKGFEHCPTSLFTHIMQRSCCDEASHLFSWTRSTSPNFRTANKSINQQPPTVVQNRLCIRLPPQQHGQQWLACSLSVSLGHKALLDKRNANLEKQ